MLTLHIEDKGFEDIFVNKFHSDMKNFIEYVKATFSGEDETQQDWSHLTSLIDEAEKSGLSDKAHEEIWDDLFTKYNVS